MLLFPVARRPCVGKERVSKGNPGTSIFFEFTSNWTASPSADNIAKNSRQTPAEEEESCLPFQALCKKSRVNQSNQFRGLIRSREGGRKDTHLLYEEETQRKGACFLLKREKYEKKRGGGR